MEGRAIGVLSSLIITVVLAATQQSSGETKAAESRSGHSHACIFDRETLWTAHGTCRPQAKAYPWGVAGEVRHGIYDAALTFGMPYQVLLTIAECESALNPHARNGAHSGLFQFLAGTFTEGARALRSETGINASNLWRPLDASYVAGYLFATGKASRWQCAHWSGIFPYAM